MDGGAHHLIGRHLYSIAVQVGHGASSASLFLFQGLSAEVIQSPDMTAWVRCFSKNKRRTIFPLTFYWELFWRLTN